MSSRLIALGSIAAFLTCVPVVSVAYDGLQADMGLCLGGEPNEIVDACSRLISNAQAENEMVGMFYAMRASANTDQQQNCKDARKASTLTNAPKVRAIIQDLEKRNCAEPPQGAGSNGTRSSLEADTESCIKGNGKAQVDACSRIIASATLDDDDLGFIYAVRAAVNTDKAQNCADATKALALMKASNRFYASAQTLERNTCAAPRAAVSGRENKPQGTDYYSTLSCGQLWTERNAILARHGYCFQSQRAIAAFGKGCVPPYGKLPDNLARVVDDIKGWEQRRRCN
jgi:YARHG domain